MDQARCGITLVQNVAVKQHPGSKQHFPEHERDAADQNCNGPTVFVVGEDWVSLEAFIRCEKTCNVGCHEVRNESKPSTGRLVTASARNYTFLFFPGLTQWPLDKPSIVPVIFVKPLAKAWQFLYACGALGCLPIALEVSQPQWKSSQLTRLMAKVTSASYPHSSSSTDTSLSTRVDLFLISFLLLFMEMACIRWFPSHVMLLTFLTNTILLACFVGMSVGCLAATCTENHLDATPGRLALALGMGVLADALAGVFQIMQSVSQ